MRFLFKIIALCCFSLQCIAASISNSRLQVAIKEIDPIICDYLKKLQIPGGVIVVSTKDRVLYTKSFGKIAIDSKEQVDNNTLLAVSSLSKNVAAFVVGALVDEGKIQWTDKIRKYDKNFFLHSEELSKELTIQDLISHSIGFPHFACDSLWRAGYDRQKVIDGFKFLQQKPGYFRNYYRYQNIVFSLIGPLLEKITGKKYEDLVQKYIFNKMDMQHSSVISLEYESSKLSHLKYLISRFKHDMHKNGLFPTIWALVTDPFTFRPKKISYTHSRYNNKIYKLQHNGYLNIFQATSGISFSANDLAKWVQMLVNEGTYNGKEIVKANTFKKITTKIVDIKSSRDDDPQFPISRLPKANKGYGIGTFIAQYADYGKNVRPVIFHMGGTYGANSFFLVSPKDEIGIAVICNLGGVDKTLFPQYICFAFLDLYLNFSKINWCEKDLKEQKQHKKMQLDYENSISTIPSPMQNKDKYVGTFTNDMYGDIEIKLDKNNNLQLSNGIKVSKLLHINADTFSFPDKNMAINYYDGDSYIMFFDDKFGIFNQCRVTCFSEGNAVFKRKEDKIK